MSKTDLENIDISEQILNIVKGLNEQIGKLNDRVFELEVWKLEQGKQS